MNRSKFLAILPVVALVMFSACSRLPDHARYIPADAVATASINLKALGKKIAWNVITGSKLFKDMQDRLAKNNSKEAVSGFDKAGIDFSNTIYLYVKKSERFVGGNKIVGLVPLSDAGKWEDYVKSAFGKVTITQNGDHKEASLGSDVYVGWNNRLLIVINKLAPADGAIGGDAAPAAQGDISAEMVNAFKVPDGKTILASKYFNALEAEGHDLAFILNYEQLMAQVSGQVAEKVGMNLSSALWKDAAFTTGFDFEKGRIAGDIHYYLSPAMADIGATMGSANTDKDLLDRMPHQDLDMMLAMHMAPKGIRATLEKMNLLGAANAGLSTQGLNLDNVLNAFTGDISLCVNDFQLRAEKVTDNFMGQVMVHNTQKPSVKVTYAMKINSKADFQKLVKLAKDNGLPAFGNGFVIPVDATDSVFLTMNDQYLVASNDNSIATGYLQGTFISTKMPDEFASKVYSNPSAFVMDMQQLFKKIDPSVATSPTDSANFVLFRGLLRDITFAGGAFNNNGFTYHVDVNFMNSDENSIINLLDFGMKMNEAQKLKGTAEP